MAKQTATPSQTRQPQNAQPIIPKATDPRAELFYLLGRIEGQGVDGSKRIAELVIDLTAPPAAPEPTEAE